VRDVYLEGEGVLARAAPGALLIDSSTIDVETARAVASAAEAKRFAMLDAPVSGGVTGAQAGTLTFMVGGPADAFARAKPLLDAMGKTIVHAGAAGSGQAAKICNNMMLAISMIGVSEGFLLADKLGLDKQKLFDIASKSSGQSWAMTTYCPVPGLVPTSPANRDYQAGFTAAMMLKDLRLAQEAARTSGATTPLGAEAAALFGLFVAHGHAGLDFSGIIRFLRGM
jgi:3-hydroxyisobutyrate dehydrogenase